MIKKKGENSSMKSDLQRVLDRLYNCRDLEIANLWQRSIFLSVFVILCFTAHGYLLMENSSVRYFASDNGLTSVLCLVGIVVSIILICMAKASKAWYEVYEEAITTFERKHFKTLGIPKENIMGNMNIRSNILDKNIFSANGGQYSPSKINIVIGQASLIWWISTGILGVIEWINEVTSMNIVLPLTLFVLLILVVGFLLKFQKLIGSGFLGKAS